MIQTRRGKKDRGKGFMAAPVKGVTFQAQPRRQAWKSGGGMLSMAGAAPYVEDHQSCAPHAST